LQRLLGFVRVGITEAKLPSGMEDARPPTEPRPGGSSPTAWV
jgi:hypothetical protein